MTPDQYAALNAAINAFGCVRDSPSLRKSKSAMLSFAFLSTPVAKTMRTLLARWHMPLEESALCPVLASTGVIIGSEPSSSGGHSATIAFSSGTE